MIVFASSIQVLCLAIAAISAWPANDTNRASRGKLCTGTFRHKDGSPPFGSRCVGDCHYTAGGWGKSWCYTNSGNWGAECVKCTDDYCDMEPKNEHTMCKYKDATGGEVTTRHGRQEWEGEGGNGCKIIFRGIDRYTAPDNILNQLNMRRNMVAGGEVVGQPSASNMKRLVWSHELETIAQRWADQCNTGAHVHDEHRNKLDGTAVGQNVFKEVYPRRTFDYVDANLEDAFKHGKIVWVNYVQRRMVMKFVGKWTDAWYNEVKYFDKANIKPFKSNDANEHYTQEVWAETEEVGCGMTFYLTAEQKEQVGKQHKEKTDIEYYTGLLVCNFAKSGNTLGGEMYKEGTPASKCDSGYSADRYYPNLCSNLK